MSTFRKSGVMPKTLRYSLRTGTDKYWEIYRGGEEVFGLDKAEYDRAAAEAHVKRYNDSLPKFEVRQVERIRFKYESASGSEYICCRDLAMEAWGKIADGGGLSAMAYLWRRFGPPIWGTDPHKRIACWILTTPDPSVFLGLDLSASAMAYNVRYYVRQSIWDPLRGTESQHRRWENAFWKWFLKQNPHFVTDPEDCTEAARELWGKWRFDAQRIAEAKKAIGPFPNQRIKMDVRKNWRKAPEPVRRVNQALFDAMRELLRPVSVRDCSINIFGRAGNVPMLGAEPSIFAGLGVPIGAMKKLLRSK